MNVDNEVIRNVQRLLGISSFPSLVNSLVERICLPGGKFESHEFGRFEHSTASGAAGLIGLSGIPAIADQLVAPMVDALCALVGADGKVIGHDLTPDGSSTSWREAQVLLGFLTRPNLLHSVGPKVGALVTHVMGAQDLSSGGWPLRQGEEPQLLFSFYPTLALARAWRLQLLDRSEGAQLLSGVSLYLARSIRMNDASTEEQLLALHALRVLASAWPDILGQIPDIPELTTEVLSRVWTSAQGLKLADRPVVVYRQPIWHAIIWRPLLYLALRGASPATPLQALIAQELISSFDPDIGAWHGPQIVRRTGQGVSWASSLALRTVYALAQDLVAWGLTADEWLERSYELVAAQYDFDVAISFAGSDREVAAEISTELKNAGYRIFYDRDYQHALLGEELTEYLQDTYFRRSRFAVVIISPAFRESKWAGQWEWKAVLARMQDQRGAYLLPYIMEDTNLPGLNKTLGYVSHNDFTPTQFAALVVRKLREGS